MRVAILDAQGVILRLEDISEKGMAEGYRPKGTWIEADASWEAGGTVADGVYTAPSIAVYPIITPRQIRLALLSAGITEDQVDAALAGNASGRIEWKFANQFRRDHPLIDAMAGAFGLTEAQVDALWLGAADL